MKKRKFKLWHFIVLLILIAIVISIVVQLLTASSVLEKTTSELNLDLYRASLDISDNTYFKTLEINQGGVINAVFVDNGKEVKYFVNAILEINNYWDANVNKQLNVFYNGQWIQETYDKVINGAILSVNENGEPILNQKINTPIPTTPVWQSILLSMLPQLIFFFIFVSASFWIVRRSSGGQAGGGIFNPEKSIATRIISNKKFSDVAGNYEVKEEVMELVDYLKYPKKYANAGARIPKGILLGGPPGTGKTLIAKALAGEANVPFYFISASNFVEMYVGVGAKRVRELFRQARKDAPSIIFIDELDAVGRSRGSGIGGGNDEREQTLNQLLVEMDGMAENNGILVIAATNRTDVLDPALQRPGRFDRTITVNYPDIKEREEILKLHARGKRISKSVSFANIAKRTPGYSGAQLENVINEASILSVREGTRVITNEQIDEAIDRVMAGPAKKNRVITEEERIMVAYHEAGHAVVGIKLPGGTKVQKITIIPRGNAGGYNLMLPENEKYNATKLELESSIASFMGGRVAEEIIYGSENISTGAANDIEKATKIARKMVTQYGMSSLGAIQYEENEGSPFLGRDYTKNTGFSAKIGGEIDNEIRKIIFKAKEQAEQVIKENLQLLELIKNALLENETIVAEEIEYLAKHLKPFDRAKQKQIEVEQMELNDLINDVINDDDDSIPFPYASSSEEDKKDKEENKDK